MLYWMETDDQMDGRFRATAPGVTNELLRLVAEIDEFKGAWLAIGRLAPDRLAGLRRVGDDRKRRFVHPNRRCDLE